MKKKFVFTIIIVIFTIFLVSFLIIKKNISKETVFNDDNIYSNSITIENLILNNIAENVITNNALNSGKEKQDEKINNELSKSADISSSTKKTSSVSNKNVSNNSSKTSQTTVTKNNNTTEEKVISNSTNRTNTSNQKPSDNNNNNKTSESASNTSSTSSSTDIPKDEYKRNDAMIAKMKEVINSNPSKDMTESGYEIVVDSSITELTNYFTFTKKRLISKINYKFGTIKIYAQDHYYNGKYIQTQCFIL